MTELPWNKEDMLVFTLSNHFPVEHKDQAKDIILTMYDLGYIKPMGTAKNTNIVDIALHKVIKPFHLTFGEFTLHVDRFVRDTTIVNWLASVQTVAWYEDGH